VTKERGNYMPIIELDTVQKYLDWLKEKIYLNSKAESAKTRKVYRGQVYKCSLGKGIGSEQDKERPCVILQYNSANNTSPNTIVAPITHTASRVETVIPIEDKRDDNGVLILDGNVLLGNIVCVSKARLGGYVTALSSDDMKKVDEALAISINLKHYYKTLSNQYNDKLEYIEKLNAIRKKLNEELEEKKKFEDKVNQLLSLYNISSIDELDTILSKNPGKSFENL
jgi:mRNA interferase MazF